MTLCHLFETKQNGGPLARRFAVSFPYGKETRVQAKPKPAAGRDARRLR
jgi:hypothetical protein